MYYKESRLDKIKKTFYNILDKAIDPELPWLYIIIVVLAMLVLWTLYMSLGQIFMALFTSENMSKKLIDITVGDLVGLITWFIILSHLVSNLFRSKQ